jgi:hypothetical protein
MIPATALAYLKALEDAAVPLKPRIKVKAKGIPIGSYDVIADAAGKKLVKPKVRPKGQTLNQQYAAKNRKRYRGAK